MNSRQKGARGEREAAKEWARVMGGEARRGQQFSGGKDSPDIVIAHENIHVEVKRVEVGNPYRWMEQAARDAAGKVPVVMHRRNAEEWLVIVRLADVPRFILAAQDGEASGQVGTEEVPPDDAGESVPAACPKAGLPRVCGVRQGEEPCGDRHRPDERPNQPCQHLCRRVDTPKNDSLGGPQ